MNYYSFNELSIGLQESFSKTITDDMMQMFRLITGDVNPLHNDGYFAVRHGFDNKVVFGMLTASLFSTMAGVYLPGEKCLIQSIEAKFLLPVYAGDTLNVIGEIVDLNDTMKQITIKVDIFNQEKKRVVKGKIKTGILEE